MKNLGHDPMEAVGPFLREHIAGFAELGILLWLREHSERDWSAAEVSEAVESVSEFALLTLQSLEEQSLLSSTGSAGMRRYRYAPGTRELAQAVDALASVYQESRWLVLRAMNDNAVERLRRAACITFVAKARR